MALNATGLRNSNPQMGYARARPKLATALSVAPPPESQVGVSLCWHPDDRRQFKVTRNIKFQEVAEMPGDARKRRKVSKVFGGFRVPQK